MTHRSPPAYSLGYNTPVRRDLHFHLPADRIGDWHGSGGPIFTAFLNTFSIVLPVGERFFIDAVRAYRDEISDPELHRAVLGFIGQEAMHGREHSAYNELLFERVPTAIKFEQLTVKVLSWITTHLPKSSALSGTIALEHFTALLADSVLSVPALAVDVEPHFEALWRWHSLEETEHKSVAFDVWRAVRGHGLRAYGQRVLGLVLATIIFWSMTTYAFFRVLRAERLLTNIPAWFRFLRFTWGDVGLLRRQLGKYVDYLRPGFHPWDHDNRALLQQMDEFLETRQYLLKPE